MVNLRRGQVWWAELGEPVGSTPAYRRPVIVVQANFANQSRLPTVIVVVLTSNLDRARDPHNFVLSAEETGLPLDSVVNASQFVTLDKRLQLREYVGEIGAMSVMQLNASIAYMMGLKGDIQPT
ncbi:MAG: type II toxin-antitoxin system PemK/MazF family toxin [Pleurocapsa sp. SU_196_0]|nr:type II toxin-antitoxin system PemK/MazF family toxin [Pleurocapsa sp. SU_196_0]